MELEILRLFSGYTRPVTVGLVLFLRRLRWRAVLAAAALLAPTLALGCGDDAADPIIRLSSDGGLSTGGVDGAGGRTVLDAGDLCTPCSSHYDCAEQESCVQLTRGGYRFCSHACGYGNGRCPSGYVCGDVYNLSSAECVPEVGDCGHAIP
jgi:hypothetical protein